MSDYSKLSDFEINKRVAGLMPFIVSDVQSASLKAYSSSVLVNDIVSEWEFNPCNNPSDAWPIIVENKISVTNEIGEWVAMDGFKVEDQIAYCNNWETDKNPLRAAMIVFLMMKDAENETNTGQ